MAPHRILPIALSALFAVALTLPASGPVSHVDAAAAISKSVSSPSDGASAVLSLPHTAQHKPTNASTSSVSRKGRGGRRPRARAMATTTSSCSESATPAFSNPPECATVPWPSEFPQPSEGIPARIYDLRMQETTVCLGGTDSMHTRTYGGTIPGCTIKIVPGEVLAVILTNELTDQGLPSPPPQGFGYNDETNLHLHGLHISGDWPSDSIHRVIAPNNTLPFVAKIPDDHMPGTHWIHPHRHGSTTLQVAGGAASVVLVEPASSNYFGNPAVDDPNPNILMFMPVYGTKCDSSTPGGLDCTVTGAAELWTELVDADHYNDNLLTISRSGNFALLNGKIMPQMDLTAGTWKRFRLVNTAYYVFGFDFKILDSNKNNACEMRLLTKDGIFVREKGWPDDNYSDQSTYTLRKISGAQVPPGGRADVMVCCPTTGDFNIQAYSEFASSSPDQSNPYAGTVHVTGNSVAACPTLAPVNNPLKDRTDYLQSTFREESDMCSCTTTLQVQAGPEFVVNGVSFVQNRATHKSVKDQLQERHLTATGHPYHQHVIPYQLKELKGTPSPSPVPTQDGYDVERPFNMQGDWHDVFDGDATIRFNPVLYTGKMIFHCHKLPHEDQGMMGTEQIQEPGSTCLCDSQMATMDPEVRDIPPIDEERLVWYYALLDVLEQHMSETAAVLLATGVIIYLVANEGARQKVLSAIEFAKNAISRRARSLQNERSDETARLVSGEA